jgi:glycosyltransferase involved in cell wall biosynthesis
VGNRSLRVVHVCKVKGIAGAERHLLCLLPALVEQGVDARLLVLEDPASPAEGFCRAARDRGVPVETVTITGHLNPGLVGRIAARLQRTMPDLVHTHMIHGDLYGLAAARRAGIGATVSTRHDNNPFRRQPVMRWLNGRAMGRARRIIAISRSLARFVRDVEGARPESLVTIYYGLDVGADDRGARDRARAALGWTDTEQVIGFVGRLIPQKGVDVLLDAFAHVHETRPATRLAIVGDGPLRAKLQARIARRLPPGTVVLSGWIDDAMSVMPGFDVMAVPSRWEGLGLVALEALACACPVVASAVDALPEIVEHRETGLLVPADEPAALGGALGELLDDPALSARLGHGGRERVRSQFSIGRMVRATLVVYEDALAASRPHPRQRAPRERAGSGTDTSGSP